MPLHLCMRLCDVKKRTTKRNCAPFAPGFNLNYRLALKKYFPTCNLSIVQSAGKLVRSLEDWKSSRSSSDEQTTTPANIKLKKKAFGEKLLAGCAPFSTGRPLPSHVLSKRLRSSSSAPYEAQSHHITSFEEDEADALRRLNMFGDSDDVVDEFWLMSQAQQYFSCFPLSSFLPC